MSKDKPLLMAKLLPNCHAASNLWLICEDTEADIIATKTHGIKVVSVYWGGIRSFTPN
jgi:phosphoglycolate phosphatase-like HAD superfamily hydrolase